MGIKPQWQKREKIEDLIDDNLKLLNNGSETHLCTRTGNFSFIDLTFCDPTLTPILNWEVISYIYGSDYFPIHTTTPIETITRTIDPIFSRRKHETADWQTFTKLSKIKNPNITTNDNANDIIEVLTRKIWNAASQAIKKTSIVK